ncbi:hypothetical protein L484_024188 [Morus notabilis]|uniref:Uncharacterized protein n=1 Tax=Morus notabilis TaxID=981085 RepID=W9RLZ5_9ROSA|nr:hypothetical protein L484_024188 [Morus notabilis]
MTRGGNSWINGRDTGGGGQKEENNDVRRPGIAGGGGVSTLFRKELVGRKQRFEHNP